ncbi:MAG: metallophosphoesterase [Lachnospiraceae bacterium]|nr:metallophosphoesterase [Lachnospiraceae bacterium]
MQLDWMFAMSVLGVPHIVLICAVLLCSVLLAVGIIDGNRFVVVQEKFTLPHLTKPCKFVLISDLHNKVYGKENNKVIAAIRKIHPDFIVVAGDVITSTPSEDITAGVALLNALSREYHIYYGLGNHESKIKTHPERFGDKFQQYRQAITHKNLKILENDTCLLPEYGIALTGLELDLQYFAHFKKKDMENGYLKQTIGAPQKNYCHLLIAHNPDYFEDYARWGADLVLSGHVHGGIMRLPLLGGVIAPSYTLFPKYDGGVFYEGNATMLLGRGLGSHTLPFRFFNPAELYEVQLLPKQ